jgi:5-formyltetrahydrofolate cyclo-ligase
VISSTKPELRAVALARRDALAPDAREAAAKAVAARELPVDLGVARVVAGYSPIRSEIDPWPLMRALAQQGLSLALPAVAAVDQPLVFRAWRDGMTLVRGRLGILEPPADAEEVAPDLVLVPLAAFDREGHRVGYGAGHYDRTLAHLRAAKPVITAGLAFSVQEVSRVPSLPHDVRLDYIATERETIMIRSC